MAKEKLAIWGGQPILQKPLPQTYNIDNREIKAVEKVMRRGPLSDFLGRAGDHFEGGDEVKKLEKAFMKKFRTRYAVSFNSATTALEAAIASLELRPGSEIIVPPYTMSATITAVLVNNLTPIFADIDKETFSLDPASIESKITKKTRAIFTTNLFGGSCDYQTITRLCKKYNLKLIEDNAQAAGAKYKNVYLGTIGDIGVFSFNVHKTIQAGEGGVLLTNNEDIAFRAQLKRNHGEQVLDDLDRDDIFMIGSNYRMSEIHATACYEQLKKLDFLNKKRVELARYLSQQLKNIRGLASCFVPSKIFHVYYLYPILFNEREFGINRKQFSDAMKAEGFELNEGYIKPMHLLTFFQGNKTYEYMKFLKKQSYKKGSLPVVEKMYEKDLLLTDICRYPLTKRHIDLFVSAIVKIQNNVPQFSQVKAA